MSERYGENKEQVSSLWRDARERLFAHKLAIFGGCFFFLMILFCALGPFIFTTYSYQEINLSYGAQGPSADHWFGTDEKGRDIFIRILYGGRISIGIGLAATSVALLIGVLYGAIAGFVGGAVDSVMMRLVEIMYSIPFTIFVILLMTLFQRNIYLLFIAVGCVEWLTMARIVRGQILAIRHQAFVEAAECMGAGNSRIIFSHLIPNVLGPIIVYATLTVPSVMLLESFISFLGLGVQPPMSSWGLLIRDGATKMSIYPWLLIFPASLFSLTLFSLNFLGDGLRDALDPKG